MKEQEYILENCEAFELNDIFDCGQCFRWNKIEDESYIGIFKENVINVQEDEKQITFKGICSGDIKDIVTDYFDLNRDYDKIQSSLSKIDEPLKQSISYGKGIRLLNQDLWETIISFIISANNNIPRIKGIIERISKQYGKEIKYCGQSYYTFPTVEELSRATVEDLRKLGLGFRDQRVYETTHAILNKQVDLNKLQEENDTDKIKETLLTLSGVGPKVADCIMLFSTLKRLDAFPIDVWVRRVMNELYLAGIAQQYLFYWKREA